MQAAPLGQSQEGVGILAPDQIALLSWAVDLCAVLAEQPSKSHLQEPQHSEKLPGNARKQSDSGLQEALQGGHRCRRDLLPHPKRIRGADRLEDAEADYLVQVVLPEGGSAAHVLRVLLCHGHRRIYECGDQRYEK